MTYKRRRRQYMMRLTQATGLALRLEQSKDIVFADRALDVADDATRRVVHEFNTDLDHTTTRASTTKHLGNLFSVSITPGRTTVRSTIHAEYVRAQA